MTCCTVQDDFGAIGDGAFHRLGTYYGEFEAAAERLPAIRPYRAGDEWKELSMDWAALQSAVLSCDSIHLPCGTYVLGGKTLLINGSKRIHGEGIDKTIILYGSPDRDEHDSRSSPEDDYWDVAVWINASRSFAGESARGSSYWELSELTIDCERTGCYCLRLGRVVRRGKSANSGVLENIRLTGATQAGLHLVSSQSNTFRSVHCHRNAGDGCRVEAIVDATEGDTKLVHSTNTAFYGCNFNLNGGHGLQANSAAVFSFHTCLFEGNKGNGIHLNIPDSVRRLSREDDPGMDQISHAVVSRSVLFDRCHFERNNRRFDARFPFDYTAPWLSTAPDVVRVGHLVVDSEATHECFRAQKWLNIEVRSCRFATNSIARWNGNRRFIHAIVAGKCEMTIWYPDVPGVPVGTDTNDPETRVTIYDRQGPVKTRMTRGGGWVLNIADAAHCKSRSHIVFHVLNGIKGPDDDKHIIRGIFCNVREDGDTPPGGTLTDDCRWYEWVEEWL